MENEPVHSEKGGLLSAWMQLVRLPNLLTVPGDPLAGFLIAMAGMSINLPVYNIGPVFMLKLSMLITPAILIYTGGLIHNDLCGLKEDRIKSPHRPLPSGRISPLTATMVMILLFAGGITMAGLVSFSSSGKWYSMAIASTLVLCVLLYNTISDKYLISGCIAMGMCRGLSFLFGASLMMSSELKTDNATVSYNSNLASILIMSALWTLYIASVTYLASNETERFKGRFSKLFPSLAYPLWIYGVYLSVNQLPETWHLVTPTLATITMAFLSTLYVAIHLKTGVSASVVRGSVGLLIRNIILIQASVCFLQPAGLYPGIFLLIFFLGHILLSQRFYAT